MYKIVSNVQKTSYLLLVAVTLLLVIINVLEIAWVLLFNLSVITLLFSVLRVFLIYFVTITILKTHYKEDWKLITGLQIIGGLAGLTPIIRQIQDNQPIPTITIGMLVLQGLFLFLLLLSKGTFDKQKTKKKLELPKRLEFLNKEL